MNYDQKLFGEDLENLKTGVGKGMFGLHTDLFPLSSSSFSCLKYNHDGWSSRRHFEVTRMRGPLRTAEQKR